MARIIALLAILTAAFMATDAATVDPIVGKWMWGTRAAEVMADHTATREFGTTGTWKFLEEGGSERTYQFSWENGRLTDDVSLSQDQKTADVRSSLDETYKATRIGAVPAGALAASGPGAPAANSEVARAQNERTAKYVRDLEALMRLLLEAKTPEFYKAVKAEHDAYADGGETEGYAKSVSVPGNARILRNVFEADLATIERNGGAPRKPAVAAADPFDIPTKEAQGSKSNTIPAPVGTPTPAAEPKIPGLQGEVFPKPAPILPAAQAAAPLGRVVVTGRFYVNVDDEVWLFVNGKAIFHRGGAGKEQSGEFELAVGDRITARLHNVVADRYLMLLFVSSDKTKIVSFPHAAFKILPDPESTDFSVSDFARNGKIAKEDRGRARQALASFPFKHHSEAVWGERDDCALGCVITPSMFGANSATDVNGTPQPSPYKVSPLSAMGRPSMVGVPEVAPFVEEWASIRFEPESHEVPDELRATVSSSSVHIGGTKQSNTQTIRGRSSGYFGKEIFFPIGTQAGALSAKVPSAQNVFYGLSIERHSGTVEHRRICLVAGEDYSWDAREIEGKFALEVKRSSVLVCSVSCEAADAKAFGFSAAVREPGDMADLTIGLNPRTIALPAYAAGSGRSSIAVLKATYGIGTNVTDFTGEIKAMVRDNRLPFKPGLTLRPDPLPGVRKELRIWYKAGDRQKEAAFTEDQDVVLQ